MEKIVKFNSKKYQIFNNSYYISDFDTIENFNNAKMALKNGKIVVGNFNENNYWDCFFIIPNNNSNYFLYKSSDGKIPSEKLKDYINQITNNNYVIKINKNIENDKNELSEIDAIENTKIIMEQIQNNKNNFIDNFENYKNFFKEKKKN